MLFRMVQNNTARTTNHSHTSSTVLYITSNQDNPRYLSSSSALSVNQVHDPPIHCLRQQAPHTPG